MAWDKTPAMQLVGPETVYPASQAGWQTVPSTKVGDVHVPILPDDNVRFR